MSDFNPQQALGSKVGPLPLGVWAVLAGGVVGGYILWQRHKAAAVAPAPTPAASTLNGGALDNTQAGSLFTSTGASAPASSSSPAPITDNDQWRQAAEIALVAKGYLPTTVDDAISAYLSGAGMTPQQSAIINLAINAVGPAPITPPPALPGTVESPVAPPPSAPIVTSPAPTAQPAAPAPITTPVVSTGRTGPTLRSGSSGASVSTLQSLLNAHGAHLAVDGKFGPLTLAAVRTFQSQQHIAVDGIVGPVTWSRL